LVRCAPSTLDFFPEADMRLLRSLLLAPLALLLVAADPASDKDAKALQGTWKVVSFEKEGKNAPEDVTKALTMTIKGDMITVNDGKKDESATFSLDATKKPKTMDLVPKQGDKVLFIYDVDGDNLKLAWRLPDQGRPKEFTAKDNEGNMVLKRSK
jgi:uncharacterized protein (TIGR03067 family)